MKATRRIIGCAVVLAVTGSVLPATLAWGAERAVTTVTIGEVAPGDFAGDLKSPRAVCKVDRKVTVFRVQPGDDEPIGSDRSDGDTSWLVNTDLTSGRYYAKVRRTERCLGAVSTIIQIPTT